MILPIPVKRPVQLRSFRFIDLGHYEKFFDDLGRGFPQKAPPISFGCSKSANNLEKKESLEVFQVGNYVGSFVPTIAEFSQLDERFGLPAATWDQIPEYNDYSFAVFQLSEGSLRPHPKAHEFETGSKDIFFPTLHIHDGKVHPTEEFDHELYLQHAGFDSTVGAYVTSGHVDPSTHLTRSRFTATRFCSITETKGIIEKDLMVHRKIIRGQHKNDDTVIKTSGDPVVASLNLRPSRALIPWIFGLSAFSWLVGRRNRIMKEKCVADRHRRWRTENETGPDNNWNCSRFFRQTLLNATFG